MVKKTSFKDNICPIARTLDIAGDGWSLLIVRDALRGITKFSDFERSLEIPKNALTQRLKSLVANGILEISPGDGASKRSTYVLTPKGRELKPALDAFKRWGETYLPV